MAPSSGHPATLKAAQPRHGQVFDAWNSSSAGHQRAENRLGGSTGWRESRNAKLQSQFRGGTTGGRQRVSDTVGAGAAKPLITSEATTSVMDMLARPGAMKQSMSAAAAAGREGDAHDWDGEGEDEEENEGEDKDTGMDDARGARQRKIFDGVVVYVNGSTHPLISDHKLKQVLAENGARTSIHLGRRQVTHVILGKPAAAGRGTGGGLASGKLQKEIQKVRGASVKFVGVEWILESLKSGKRLPETRFSNLKMASKGQQSVYGLCSKTGGTSSAPKGGPPSSGQS